MAEFDSQGKVKHLIEKTEVSPSNFALAGIYFFNHIIKEACNSINPSWRNELKITDAIQWLIDKNRRAEASKIEGWWKDTGKSEDILEANRLILDDINPKNEDSLKESRHLGEW